MLSDYNYRKRTSQSVGCGAVLFQLLFFVAIWLVMAVWTNRNLDFWISHFKGEQVDVPFWISLVAAIVAPFTFIGNLIAEVARYAI